MAVFRSDRDKRRRSNAEAGIRRALDEALEVLRFPDATLELVSFEPGDGIATVRADGGCDDCDFPLTTLAAGLEAHLQQRVPSVRSVRFITP